MDVMDILTNYHVTSLLLGIIILYLFYRLSTRNHSYWLKRNINFVEPMPMIGSWSGFWKKNQSVDVERIKRYGKVYGSFEGTIPVITIAEPKLLRNIMVKDFNYFPDRREGDSIRIPILNKSLLILNGEEWKRIRSLAAPTYSTNRLKKIFHIFQDCSETLIENLRKAADKNIPIDVIKYFGAYGMDTITHAAFSTRMDSHNEPENEFTRNAKNFFKSRSNIAFHLFRVCPAFMEKYLSKYFLIGPMKFFKDVTLEIIRERKKTGKKRDDFLQLLLDINEETTKEQQIGEDANDIARNYSIESSSPSFYKTSGKKQFSLDELVAQCVTFFLGGYHSISQTIGFSAYQLAMNQDIQEKLFQEISDVLEGTNGILSYEALEKMEYLDNIISEILRLYPASARIERQCIQDYELHDLGITLPKGMIVVIPLYALHRDPISFPDPEKFNPDRFSAEGKKLIQPYSYLPFGAGPRNCVGLRFALLEAKVCLVHVLSTFRFKTCSETKLLFGKGLKLLRPKPIVLSIERRDFCPLNRNN